MSNTGFGASESQTQRSGFNRDAVFYEHQTVKVNAETDIAKNKIDAEKESSRLKLENEAKKQKSEFIVLVLDKFISPSFLSFLVILGLMTIGGFVVWKRPFENALEFWNIILPIITSFMGYAFGRYSSNRKLNTPSAK